MQLDIRSPGKYRSVRHIRFVEELIDGVLGHQQQVLNRIHVNVFESTDEDAHFECRVSARINRNSTLSCSAEGASYYECINNALRRLQNAISHRAGRLQSRRHVRRQEMETGLVEYN